MHHSLLKDFGMIKKHGRVKIMITQENIPYTADEIKAMIKTCEKYNKVHDRAEKIYNTEVKPDEAAVLAKYLPMLFPDLKKSKDERIRKELIAIYSVGAKVNAKTGDIPDRDIVAWLEKQGKQNTVEWSEEDEKIKESIKKVLANTNFNKLDIKYSFYEMISWLEKQNKQSSSNIPSRELILSIWDLGNEWKELTNGSISTEYGTQLDFIQKHWRESSYYNNITII